MRRLKRLQLCIVIIIMLALSATASADNLVSWQMAKQGTTEPVDTIYVGGNYQLQIMIENDAKLAAFLLNLEISSPDGIIWDYQDMNCSIIPDSRMDMTWYLTGFTVEGGNIDGAPADSFAIFAGTLNGMLAGPLEPMFGFNIIPLIEGEWANGYLGTICIEDHPIYYWGDTPSYFANEAGESITPDYTPDWCWPVVMICGNPNGDAYINVGDAVFLINHIFKQGPAPNLIMLGDTNLDNAVNVGDVVYLINSIFKDGPPPTCPGE